jgi:RNA 2',3'-cyclic 3'-phosphodiesterase
LLVDAGPSLLLEAPAAPLARNTFFALYPDAAAAARIATLARELRDEHGLTSHPLKTENFHVSLHPLAGVIGSPREIIDAACEAAMAVSSCRFDVVFDCAGSFERKRGDGHPFVLQGSEGLVAVKEFHQALHIAMRRNGCRGLAKTFTPHVTLLYDRELVGLRRIDPVRWRVNEFVLVQSLVGHATHVPLGRWNLGSRGRPEHAGLDGGFVSATGLFRTFDAP